MLLGFSDIGGSHKVFYGFRSVLAPQKPYQNSDEHGKARDHISNVIEGQLDHVRKKSHEDKDDTANQNNHNAVAGTLLRR